MKPALEYVAVKLAAHVNIPLPKRAHVKTVELLPDIITDYSDEVLYLVPNERVSCLFDENAMLPSNVIYSEKAAPTKGPLQANAIVLSKAATVDSVSAILSEVYAFIRKYHCFLEDLMISCSFENTIQAIVDRCYDFWQSPVAVYDTSYKLIACSSQYIADNPRVQAVMDSGYMQRQAFDILNKQNRLKIYSSSEAYQITDITSLPVDARLDGQDFGYIDVPIRAGKKIVGCMALISLHRPLSVMDADCLLDASRLVSMSLQRDGVYMQTVINPYEGLLYDLLRGFLTDARVIAARFSALGRTLQTNLFVLTIPLSTESDSNSELLTSQYIQQLQSDLRILIPDSVSAYFEGNIVFLVTKPLRTPPVDQTDPRLKMFLSLNKLSAGISRPFRDPSALRCHYEQALEALRLAQATDSAQTFYSYINYSNLHMLKLVSKTADIRDFCHPAILELSASNKPMDKALLDTLYFYLFYLKDWAKVCDQLHIHRSTLFYRINKIKQIIAEDLDDGNVVYNLMHSFKVLDYIKNFT